MIEIDLDGLSAAVDKAFNTAPEQLEKLLRRIGKALALAEDVRGDAATREAAQSMAARLMAQYGITAAMLGAAGETNEAVGDVIIGIDSPYLADKAQLLYEVVLALRGQALYGYRTTTHRKLHVFAMGADLERIQMLWASLLKQVTNELSVAQCPDHVRQDVFRRSYFLGFTREVRRRIEQAEAHAKVQAQTEQDASPDGMSVALVFAGRNDQVRRALEDVYPERRKGRARKQKVSVFGLAAGAAAGQRADLGRSVTS